MGAQPRGYYKKTKRFTGAKVMRKHKCIWALLILLPLVNFWPVLEFGFVWDDEVCHLHDNPHMNTVNWESVKYFWLNSHEGMYIPVTYTAWSLLKYGQDVWGKENTEPFSSSLFHLVNLILHIANGLLVFALLHLLVSHRGAACGGALFFLLHPLQIESVAWVSEFRGLLSSFLALSAMWQYCLYLTKQKKHYYILATIFFILATLAKPSTVILPLILGILEYFIFSRPLQTTIKSLALWFVIAAGITFIAKQSQPNDIIKFVTPIIFRPLIFIDACNFYLAKLILPIPLSAMYGRGPEKVMEASYFFYNWIPLAILAFFLWHYRDKSKMVLVALIIFIIGFLPVSGLLPFAYQNNSTVADRYLYLSLLGPALLFSHTLQSTIDHNRNRNHNRVFHYTQITWITLALLLSFYSYRIQAQLPIWKNKITLWQDVLSKYPNQDLPHNNLGKALHEKGEIKKASDHFLQALEIDPNYAGAHNNLGSILSEQGKAEQAIYHFSCAIKIDPNYAQPYNNLGNIYQDQGSLSLAIDHYNQALKLNPYYAEAHSNMGNVLLKQKKYSQALQHYLVAQQSNPYDPIIWHNLGCLFLEQKQLKKAHAYYKQTLKIKPDFFQSYLSLAKIYIQWKEPQQAQKCYEQVLKIDPSNRVAQNQLQELQSRKN